MIDPELKSSLNEINNNLADLKNKKSPGIWRHFFNGIFSALGYVAGLALVIVVITWILNWLGLLPAFKQQVQQFQSFMSSTERLVSGANNSQQQNNGQSNSQGSYMITLPDGRKAEVTPQQ